MKETITDILKDKHKTPGFHYLFFTADSIKNDITDGLQNIENNIELNDRTSFHVFSATKTFTAVAVMQLVQANKINLTDSIQHYLPEYQFSKPISIGQLLSHQSGLANPIPLKWTHLKDEHFDFDYSEFTNTVILQNLKLKRTPGKKYSYSNINYLVLGKLIERISGRDYNTFITENILEHLEGDEFIDFEYPDSNHAKGYHPNSFFQKILLSLLLDKKKITYTASNDWTAFHPFYVSGAPYGGLFASPKALMHYCQAILNNQILDSVSVNMMLTEQKDNSGKKTGMSLGWFRGELNEQPYYCHAGGGGGYYIEIRVYPTLNYGSVIMTNASGMNDKRILDKLDNKSITSESGEK